MEVLSHDDIMSILGDEPLPDDAYRPAVYTSEPMTEPPKKASRSSAHKMDAAVQLDESSMMLSPTSFDHNYTGAPRSELHTPMESADGNLYYDGALDVSYAGASAIYAEGYLAEDGSVIMNGDWPDMSTMPTPSPHHSMITSPPKPSSLKMQQAAFGLCTPDAGLVDMEWPDEDDFAPVAQSAEEEKYGQKLIHIKSQYDVIQNQNAFIANRLYHIRKTIEKEERLNRVLMNRLDEHGDEYYKQNLLMPDIEQEPTPVRSDPTAEEIAKAEKKQMQRQRDREREKARRAAKKEAIKAEKLKAENYLKLIEAAKFQKSHLPPPAGTDSESTDLD